MKLQRMAGAFYLEIFWLATFQDVVYSSWADLALEPKIEADPYLLLLGALPELR
jgi:hypothetical protein